MSPILELAFGVGFTPILVLTTWRYEMICSAGFYRKKIQKKEELEGKAVRFMDGIIESTMNSQLGDGIMFAEEYNRIIEEIDLLDRQLKMYRPMGK